MPVRLRQSSIRLVAVFFAVLVPLLAQDSSSYISSPDVTRVGARLACRCGGCRNTVGTCPMIRCSSADPIRQRIYQNKLQGRSDDQIVEGIVREEGIVALSSPPLAGLGGILTWFMPGIALMIGFFVYYRYLRSNRQQPTAVTTADAAALDRFRSQIDRELEADDIKPDSPK